MRTGDYVMRLFTNIQKQWNMLKIVYFIRNLQVSRIINLRITGIKNAKFADYCFWMNTNI